MKVCHFTSAHTSQDERIFFKECVSLAQHGYETHIVAKGDSYEKSGIHIHGVGYPSGGRLSRMTSFAKRVYEEALALDADIYHFHDPELLHYGLKLKRKGKKVIFDSHENTVEQIEEKDWIPGLIRRPLTVVFDWYQKNICRQFDAVISVTPHICDYFRSVNPRTEMITNYPAYLPLPNVEKAACPTLCFAGGIAEQWCHRQIIQALEQVDCCIYRLCGDDDSDYFASLKELPAWEKVDYIGRIPHEEVFAMLASCHIGMSLLQHNRNAGGAMGTMGNTKIFEEMMAGLPVICTNFILWQEFVERYHCGICINPENVDEIAAAIRYLLDHPDEARQMGENGRRAVKEEFNWGVEEKKLLALYEDILKN